MRPFLLDSGDELIETAAPLHMLDQLPCLSPLPITSQVVIVHAEDEAQRLQFVEAEVLVEVFKQLGYIHDQQSTILRHLLQEISKWYVLNQITVFGQIRTFPGKNQVVNNRTY